MPQQSGRRSRLIIHDRQDLLESFKVEGSSIVEKLKALIHAGNVRRVVVEHKGKTVAEFPLTVGVVGRRSGAARRRNWRHRRAARGTAPSTSSVRRLIRARRPRRRPPGPTARRAPFRRRAATRTSRSRPADPRKTRGAKMTVCARADARLTAVRGRVGRRTSALPETGVTSDERFMRAALAQAAEAGRRGEVPVGAIVVLDGRWWARAAISRSARTIRRRTPRSWPCAPPPNGSAITG